MKVAILTGGGDCPGLNAVIRAVVRRGEQHGFEFTGVRDGWKGLLEDDHFRVTRQNTSGILQLGGTILGTSRTNPFKRPDGPKMVMDAWLRHHIGAVVAIGGEDTLGVATRFHEELGMKVVGVPEDHRQRPLRHRLHLRLRHRRDHRHRGHRPAPLHRRGPQPGHRLRGDGTARRTHRAPLRHRRRRGRDPGPRAPRRPRATWSATSAPGSGGGAASPSWWSPRGPRWRAARRPPSPTSLDDFGHVRLGGIGAYLAKEIERETGFEARVTVLGHVQRGGTPTARDRVLATRYGVFACDLVKEGRFGHDGGAARRRGGGGAARRGHQGASPHRPDALRHRRGLLRLRGRRATRHEVQLPAERDGTARPRRGRRARRGPGRGEAGLPRWGGCGSTGGAPGPSDPAEPGLLVVHRAWSGPPGAPEPDAGDPLRVLAGSPRWIVADKPAGVATHPLRAGERGHARQRRGGRVPGVRRAPRATRARAAPPTGSTSTPAAASSSPGTARPGSTCAASSPSGRWRRSTWRWCPAGSRRAASARCRWRSAAGRSVPVPDEGRGDRPRARTARRGRPRRTGRWRARFAAPHAARGAHPHRGHAPDPGPPGLPRPSGGGGPRSTAGRRRRCPGSTATSCTPGSSGSSARRAGGSRWRARCRPSWSRRWRRLEPAEGR